MKRRTSVTLACLVVVAAGGALAIGLMGSHSAADNCTSVHGVTHHVAIKNSRASDELVTGKRCDKLTITNEDAIAREVAFGLHEDHVPYDGVAERVLSKGQSLTVTLNQTGNFRWHDHLHDEVEGRFTVHS